MTFLFKISFTSTLLVESFELMTGCSNSKRRSKYLKPNLVSLYIYSSFCNFSNRECRLNVFFISCFNLYYFIQLFWNIIDWGSLLINLRVIYVLPFIAPFSPESLDGSDQTFSNGTLFDQPVLVLYKQFQLLRELERAKWYFGFLLALWWFRGINYMEIFPPIQLPVIALINSMSTILSFLGNLSKIVDYFLY